MGSPFDVLRVEPGAGEAAVDRAYRERVKEAHPDQGGSIEEFRAVRAAYEELKAGYQGADHGGPRARSGAASGGRAGAGPASGGRAGAGPASGGRAGGEPEPDGDWYRAASSHVTYLDYDVLADFGWDLADDDLFARAAAADLEPEAFGDFRVDPGQTLLEAAEDEGFAWPFACRGGACANCAILLREGELSMPVSHVLPVDLLERGFRLSCNAIPITDELEVVYNVKHVPQLDDLLLPPRPFRQAHSDD